LVYITHQKNRKEMKINVFNTTEKIIEALAKLIIEIGKKAILDKNQFTFVLSGGNSPKKLFQLLASADYRNQLDYSKVFFFFGDERYVPHNHQDSNYLMAKEAMLDALSIPEHRVFKVDTSLDPATAAQDYERHICEFFNDEPVFDFILLGLGDDAHTASIFPNTSLIWIDEEMVKEVYLEDKQVYRISFTAPIINKANHVAFLTFGANKADAIKAVFEQEKHYNKYPAQLINPESGNLYWFVDDAAVSKLDQKF
jgi:6-phosphogluconolactonase